MQKMTDLKDLLRHEILDLYSAEEQIIEALPAMIDKAQNPALKKALSSHLKITEEQKKRLDKVKQLITEESKPENQQDDGRQGFFSRLFSGGNGSQKCRGMEGLIEEGQKVISEDMSQEALDAAIIACAQKIEHYEISGYGTATAYARELQLNEAEKLLQETLSEEYEADDQLTDLAVNKLNRRAEQTGNTAKNMDKQEGGSKPSVENEMRPNRKEPSEKPASAKKTQSENKKKITGTSRSGSSPKESQPHSSKANQKEKTNNKSQQKKTAGKARKSASNNKRTSKNR
jgi:ferritin-like metal-binding protein YciE